MANKKQPTVRLRMQEDLLRRLILLSELEGRSLSNQIAMLARNAVAYHERAKGKLDTKKLAALDLSEYYDADENTDEA
ncbi:MAG: hypothetical protein J6R04_08560 [Clostridia bacterium]|nr:hypothetical protein [Clostridia bacterium]